MTDPSILYADLLTARHAESRMHGIQQWVEHAGAEEELVPLLADTAPVIRAHGGRFVVVEVRAAVLVALQDRYRLSQRPWDLGPVTVRAAMPADEAARRAATLPEDQRKSTSAAVERRLAGAVQPPPADLAACRAYLVLQEAGWVSYQTQQVEAGTWLTAMQTEIHATQMVSPRPTPHVRFDGEHGPVGYLYRDSSWILDFDESPLGREIHDLVSQWMHAVRGGVPRILFDAGGHPLRQGSAFQIDGVVPPDTGEPLDYIRSVAAFVGRRHRCEVVP